MRRRFLDSSSAPRLEGNVDWALDNRLVAGFGLLFALLVVSAGLTYHNTRQLDENAGWVTHSNEVLDALDEVLSTMKDAETGERGYIITGDDAYLEPYNSAVADIQKQIDFAKALTAENPR